MLDIITVRIDERNVTGMVGFKGQGFQSYRVSEEEKSAGKWAMWQSRIEPLCRHQSSITF